MARQVHKQEVSLVAIPTDAIREDKGLKYCSQPQLVLADVNDNTSYKNDKTGIAYLFDSMTVELEDRNGNLTTALGESITFPNQPDAVGFVIDWRQHQTTGTLNTGCYKVKINWTKAGNSGYFYYCSFELKNYSIDNAYNTCRLFVSLDDFVRKQGIDYTDSGFYTTLRFQGKFGYMQPNYQTENLIYTNRKREKIRIEALRTYELRTSYLLACMTRNLDENHLLAANVIKITDHNATNHIQDYYDFPVIIDEDQSPNIEYNNTPFAKMIAYFKDRTAESESKYI